jgi:hypothetical protein
MKSPVATVSAFLTVGYSHEKAHGWEGTNRGYHCPSHQISKE